jgi:hypothetical protein
MKLATMLTALLFGYVYLARAGGDERTDLMKMPPINPNSGLLKGDARAVFLEAKRIIKLLIWGSLIQSGFFHGSAIHPRTTLLVPVW